MTAESKVCPQCGKPLPPNAPAGLCPSCVMAMNLADQTEVSGEPATTWRAPEPAELAPKFPQLEILQIVGRGGMGAVYKARQKQLDRVVALKILPPGLADDASFSERFSREAKALARLNHPNIVTLYEFGRADGLYFFLMEFVDGLNVRELLNNKRISPREALAIVPQICDALQYAHDQGIVHRDIKPENLLLDRRGKVKVADFGLARLIANTEETASAENEPKSQGPLTEAGKIMGTPQYMAPEQVDRPQEVDHRADIYALGVVFYQMLTGELPGRPIEPPSKKLYLDVRLDDVVLRALERNPERRYQQASAMKTRVESLAEAAPVSPVPKPGGTKPIRTEPERATGSRIPRQIWVVVAFLGLEGIGNLLSIPDNPTALWWLGAKVVLIAGLLLRSRVVFILALLLSAIHAVHFTSVAPGTAIINLAMLGMLASAYRFYFRQRGTETKDSSGAERSSATLLARWIIGAMAALFLIGAVSAIVPMILNRTFSGRITDADTGQPIKGAHVLVWAGNPDRSSGYIAAFSRGKSDDDGIYRMPVPRKLFDTQPPLTFEAHMKGYGSGAVTHDKKDGPNALSDELNFRLHPAKSNPSNAAQEKRPDSSQPDKPKTTAHAFAEVVERTLIDPDEAYEKPETLHLRSGKLAKALEGAPREQGGRLRALLNSPGDLFAEYDDYVSKRWALVAAGLKLSDFPTRNWEKPAPSDLTEALKVPTDIRHVEHFGVRLYLLPEGLLPLTLAFEGRDGSRGLLQITAFNDNPHSLSIRYKLLDMY